MSLQGLFLFVAVISLGNIVLAQDTIKVGITHWGDVRSHLVPMQKNDLPNDCQGGSGNCVGGIPEIAAYIKDTEGNFHKDANTKLRFATGNLVSGETGYLSVPDFGRRPGHTDYADSGWKTFGKFLKSIEYWNETTEYYSPTFMSLGIKEFESGPLPLSLYLAEANTTTIVSNMKGSYQGLANLIKSSVVQNLPNNRQIGIVGFVNPLANDLADASPLSFADPAEEIASLIKNDATLRGLKTIIAVGSGNYNMAKSIIDKCDNVKLVIYGGGTKDLTNNYPAKEGKGWIATAGLTNGVATRLGALTLTLSVDSELVNVTGQLRELSITLPQGT
ncbi:unnamed protein product [Allacma fusca]|uniref:5'-nucleotidase n=1 Tax=Allacma fusca TaxID=39272 RepID=A0A8J2PXT5_9HEXA|nr:unnamed protein product [Allacma fusca]